MKLCINNPELSVYGRSPDGHCHECRRLSTQKYRLNLKAADPDKWRKVSRENNWRQAGMINEDRTPFTILDYDRLYQIQQGKCTICDRHQSDIGESLLADHNHETNVVRGLLCRRCNSRINILDGGVFTNRVLQYLKIKIVKES
jgi:uncharacterized protein YlaI